MHHYRLTLEHDPAEQKRLNEVMSGPRTTLEENKPQMITEAAKKIPVPSWWRGSTTAGDAHLAAAALKEGRK